VISYPAVPGVPVQLVMFVSMLLAAHRREIGTRRRTRKLTCGKEAIRATVRSGGRGRKPDPCRQGLR
jgi:hypothetical protein